MAQIGSLTRLGPQDPQFTDTHSYVREKHAMHKIYDITLGAGISVNQV